MNREELHYDPAHQDAFIVSLKVMGLIVLIVIVGMIGLCAYILFGAPAVAILVCSSDNAQKNFDSFMLDVAFAETLCNENVTECAVDFVGISEYAWHIVIGIILTTAYLLTISVIIYILIWYLGIIYYFCLPKELRPKIHRCGRKTEFMIDVIFGVHRFDSCMIIGIIVGFYTILSIVAKSSVLQTFLSLAGLITPIIYFGCISLGKKCHSDHEKPRQKIVLKTLIKTDDNDEELGEQLQHFPINQEPSQN